MAGNEPVDSTTNEHAPKQSVKQSDEKLDTKRIENYNKCNKNNSYKNKNKTRRGYGKKNNRNKISNLKLSIMGTNACGLSAKKESLYYNINTLKPSIVTIQETKLIKDANMKIPGYQIFNKTRVNKGGGGLMTCIVHNLNPVLVPSDKK